MRETGEELIRFFVCILYTSRAGSYYILSRLVATSSPADCLAPLFSNGFPPRGETRSKRGCSCLAWPSRVKSSRRGSGAENDDTYKPLINFDVN
jgi:hypothetical protein